MEEEKNVELEDRILEHVQSPKYQPVKPRVILKQLGLAPEQRRDLKKAIKSLIKRGRLSYGANHLVRPVTREQRESDEAVSGGGGRDDPQHDQQHRRVVTGTFQRTAGGYGFVRPKGTARAQGRKADIYIPARRTRDAASGDLVMVRLSRRREEGRLSGELVEVLERDTNRFVGSYRERRGEGLVQVDGKLFSDPILVGDPGAKGAREGDKVVIEMVRFPSHLYEGEGVIVEVLGARGAPGVDTLSVLREYNLPEYFPEEVSEAARQEALKFDESIGPDREDLTAMTVVTIDPRDARDFDDAISLERLENGHWLLGVHIADVSHFVPPKSPLDREARDRATSVYLPDRVIPMLPEIISNNLASLQPDRTRYTKSAFIELTPEGTRISAEVRNTAIRSKRRFTYEEVDQYLADRPAWQEKLTPEVFTLLGHMHELAMVLRRRRLECGAIELTMPEIKIDLDPEGRVAGAHLVKQTESHQIIEEFMLAANQAVAELLSDRELNFLRRIHQAPDPTKLDSLTSFVRELGIACESMQSRFEIKRVIEQVKGRPEQYAVNYAVLRSMSKAVYSPEPEGHYALAVDQYCHFTSPIRRYPDLNVHRMFTALAGGKRPVDDFNQQTVLGEHCSEREQRAEAAERDLVKLKLLNFLSQRIGEKMEAVITGVEDFGLFAQGVELPAEGMVHVSALMDDYYHYDATTHSLTGHRQGNSYRLGDLIEVEVVHVDLDRRELDFRVLRRLKSAGQEAAARPQPPAMRERQDERKGKKKGGKKASTRRKGRR